ncbi:FAST kinase domain-containing protein 2, mitochondrial [Hyla sarda]|uniref:FAST kinase domain-containing protein 2, mitochondrial n=1 Tax=Hyla sarda TaxID=327740 RepID=UPI0024C3F87A|nr:FAST kinase domain-containing protein 2, mitochondrial [Hyla sarda]XP_056389595.1 FAST kinase domain-containing protein 2, mitochondrial [Hyla sarda]XP_056389596.1 FAST kinase domain-containing protein 2, mitochondrial [Hyla sarda]XP_056389597.1 FAST kinase domain-containing protein 2, mitochondrial [Hyla sarda]
MHNNSLPYLLRTTRILQSCHCLLGVRITSLLRNCSSRSGLTLLHEVKPCSPASIATSIPIRFFCSKSAEEKTAMSVNSDSSGSHSNHVHALNDEHSQNTDQGHILDREKTKPQSNSTRPKKLSGVELLDAFTSDSQSLHELYCRIVDLWDILANNKKLKPSDMQLMSEHPNFYNLCYEVMKSAPSMSNRFLVCSLHVFLSLKVNQNTRLIQTLLNVIQKRLSSLKMDEISLLANCLKLMDCDKNVDIIHSGLCLLMELKCDTIKDVPTLQNMMRIAPANLRRKLEEKALQMIDKFTVSQCYNMFSVLAEINLHSESLLDLCSQKLINCLDELSCKRISSLVDYCSKLLYFNEKLLSAIGDNIMNNIYMWNVWQISMVLRSMTFLRFRHVPLLDYFAEKIMEESQSLRINYLITAAKVYSVVNHLPEGKGDKFLETLDTALHLHINSIKNKKLLKTVYNLCLLGLVPRSAINQLLEDKSLSTLDKTEKAYLSHIKLCLLFDLGSSPFSIKDLEKIEANHSHSVTMCHTFLKNYFKDQALYQENMQFPMSYFIDFVLTLDREQNKLVSSGDIQNFDGSQNVTRIAVLCCTANAFTLGSLHPVGKMALKLRHLKLLGFTVVVVPVNQFIMLTEAEKEAFLGENIYNDTSSSQTSVEANEADYTL